MSVPNKISSTATAEEINATLFLVEHAVNEYVPYNSKKDILDAVKRTRELLKTAQGDTGYVRANEFIRAAKSQIEQIIKGLGVLEITSREVVQLSDCFL